MEPSTKKRRLQAPKAGEDLEDDQLAYQTRFESGGYPAALMGDEPAEQSNAHQDFEQMRKTLQDAASFAEAQPNENTRMAYNNVNVLLLRWDADIDVDNDLQALKKMFAERYNFSTEVYTLPSSEDVEAKLCTEVSRNIASTPLETLLIIYYAGHAAFDSNQALSWASNTRDDALTVKWDVIKSLVEAADSDILLLLDACANPNTPISSGRGLKQAIAACGPEDALHENHDPTFTFTYNMIDALLNLCDKGPFSAARLHEEIITIRHQRSMDNSTMTNSDGDTMPLAQRTPIIFPLTEAASQTSIMLAPSASPEAHTFDATNGEAAATVASNANGCSSEPIFDEVRALVSLEFMGEPSQEMDNFRAWLDTTTATSSDVTVEGRFLGPPTIMILSMPIAAWNICNHDRVVSFLGWVKSHNMLGRHQTLSQLPTLNGDKYAEDGKILLEAALTSPGLPKHSPQQHEIGLMYPPIPNSGNIGDQIISPATGTRKDDVEDSDEMHEAAIQLKALSHVRPPGRDDRLTGRRSVSQQDEMGDFHALRDASQASHGLLDGNHGLYVGDFNATPARSKQRRSLQKPGPKQDTRCNLCSHAPFKDSSSLRKHVAAAHTRPFPCAFSFAGCQSTFGSKNEWKRHIASQHLCLNFYRCSSCPATTMDGKGNEFNRKDLFTQHLRRMHAPFQIKKGIPKNDKIVQEWEDHVKAMQQSCLITRRAPPTKSACPKPDCSNIFEGQGSWDDWTEHVGRHLEKGDAGRLGVDRYLADWALREGIIEQHNGEYRLCGQERESQAGGYYSDGPSRNQIEEASMQDHSMIDQSVEHLLDEDIR